MGAKATDKSRVTVLERLEEAAEPVVAVYCRVTQEESIQTDLSLPNQKRRAIEVCAERGWPLAKLYVEPKAVGGDAEPRHRPALTELLADIAAGRVGRVLVRHTDRLWRSTSLQDQLLRVFARHGVELWDFSGQHDFKSAHGKFSTIVLGAAAQLEKDLVAERVREMKRGKALAGRPGGGPPPFGYTSQARVRHELIQQGHTPEAAAEAACTKLPAPGRYYIDEREAAVVRQMFDLYTKEQIGARRITETMNDRGYRRRSGLPWATQKVTKVLTDPVVAGFVTYDEDAYRNRQNQKAPKHRQTLYPGEHEAIISREQWEEAGRIRERNRAHMRTKRSATRVFALTGILVCGTCGGPMVGKSNGAKLSQYAYYQCASRKYRGPKWGCAAPLVPAEDVEFVVMRDVQQLLASPEFVHDFMAKANERLAAEEPAAVRDRARLESELAAVDQAGAKYTARYESAPDAATEELAWQKLRETMERKKRVEAELTTVRAALAARTPPAVTLEETAHYLAKLHAHLSVRPNERRALLSLLKARHDLRVRVRDARAVVLSIRLDGAAVHGQGDPLRRRLVVVPGGAAPNAPATHVLSRELPLPEQDTAERWAARENEKGEHPCGCACGGQIAILPKHRTVGIPRFIHGHHRMAMTAFVEDLNAKGFFTISQAARALGMGETTLRRKTRDLGLSEERLPWGNRAPMRAYRKSEIERVREERQHTT